MRILFIGDVVGRTGREAVAARLPGLRDALRIELAVVNAENASHGFGLAPDMADTLFAAGADVITLGNHAWDRKEIIPYIAETPRLLRAVNFPPGTPGAGSALVEVKGGRRALVLQTMGRLFMDPLDDPFRTTADVLARHRLGGTVAAILVDFHAEASSEKMAFAHFLDGQVSAVIGTHTHCPSADAQVLPGGTGSSPTPACRATTTALSAWRRTPPRCGSGGSCLANDWRRPRARRPCAACSSRPTMRPDSRGGSHQYGSGVVWPRPHRRFSHNGLAIIDVPRSASGAAPPPRTQSDASAAPRSM